MEDPAAALALGRSQPMWNPARWNGAFKENRADEQAVMADEYKYKKMKYSGFSEGIQCS